MSTQTISKLFDYACHILLTNKGVRYVGVLNRMGNLIFDKEQNGVNLSISDTKSRSLYIKSVLSILFEKDFDEQIGLLKYNISHRVKVNMISIPMFNHVIIISTEPNENCDVIANSAIMIFEKILKKEIPNTM